MSICEVAIDFGEEKLAIIQLIRSSVACLHKGLKQSGSIRHIFLVNLHNLQHLSCLGAFNLIRGWSGNQTLFASGVFV